MNKPRSAEEGLADLLSCTFPQDIYQVIIRKTGGYPLRQIRRYLEAIHCPEIPESRTLLYTPPGIKDGEKVGYKNKLREEVTPKVIDASKTHLVLDDSFWTGKTFKCAVGMLQNQGVELESIWLCVGSFSDGVFDGEKPGNATLDKAKKFLEYRESHPFVF